MGKKRAKKGLCGNPGLSGRSVCWRTNGAFLISSWGRENSPLALITAGSNYRGAIITSSCSARAQQPSLGPALWAAGMGQRSRSRGERLRAPAGLWSSLRHYLPASPAPIVPQRYSKIKIMKWRSPILSLYPHIASVLYTVVLSEVVFMGLMPFPAVPALFSAHFHCSLLI